MWTNSLFLSKFVTLFQNNSFYFFELNLTSTRIRIKIEKSFLNILYCDVSLKYCSSLHGNINRLFRSMSSWYSNVSNCVLFLSYPRFTNEPKSRWSRNLLKWTNVTRTFDADYMVKQIVIRRGWRHARVVNHLIRTLVVARPLFSFRSSVSRNEFVKETFEAEKHDTEHIRDLFVTGKAVDEAAGCAIAELT